jgi:glycosyltransferase involved in cell wall biosynthesis
MRAEAIGYGALRSEVATTADPDIQLLVPEDDVRDPEISIVIPALNEELTIGDFVGWCKQGLASAGIRGEILIVDSSTDATSKIALAEGARVLRTPKRGLGRAYIDALPFVRSPYILMGDCDCTYDFRELGPFMDRFREGFEFVMGSRWSGYIEPGSMPPLHQYLGTPVTTWILNVLYSSKFSDIHCGMRGITTEALTRMDLESQSWEYASEMVLKSVHMCLPTAEVPVRFLKDRQGRLSHHKRAGWFSPFQAAWINLRAMFIYGSDFFVFKPGLVLIAAGLLITLPLSLGPVTIGGVTFSLYWMLFGMTATLLGLQSFFFGCVAQVLHDYTGDARRLWLSVFRYTRTVLISAAMFFVGLLFSGQLVVRYLGPFPRLSPGSSPLTYLAVTGLLLMIMAFMTFSFTLLLHAAALRSHQAHGHNG